MIANKTNLSSRRPTLRRMVEHEKRPTNLRVVTRVSSLILGLDARLAIFDQEAQKKEILNRLGVRVWIDKELEQIQVGFRPFIQDYFELMASVKIISSAKINH